jgi:manganese-dependent ADP-ribose/CDP-alcohol diphosphatase
MMSERSKSLLLSLLFFFLLTLSHAQGKDTVRIGIFTDCQYCNCTQSGVRYYKLSLGKLDTAIRTFNSLPLDAVFHLGDMIDHGFSNFDSVLPRFRQIRAPLHLVLGNHDYMIKSKYKPGLPEYVGMPKDHYKVEIGNWTFIVLNGDDLSYMAPQTSKQKKERNDLVGDLYSGLQGNGMPWNGGIGSEQMKWLEHKLTDAQQRNRNVIVICHFPLFTKENHNLFNNKAVFRLIASYPCVKAYFNGHYHSGNYQEREGIHLVNFKGMVDTQENAFAFVTLTSDYIIIKGYGREPDRMLRIRK